MHPFHQKPRALGGQGSSLSKAPPPVLYLSPRAGHIAAEGAEDNVTKEQAGCFQPVTHANALGFFKNKTRIPQTLEVDPRTRDKAECPIRQKQSKPLSWHLKLLCGEDLLLWEPPPTTRRPRRHRGGHTLLLGPACISPAFRPPLPGLPKPSGLQQKKWGRRVITLSSSAFLSS